MHEKYHPTLSKYPKGLPSDKRSVPGTKKNRKQKQICIFQTHFQYQPTILREILQNLASNSKSSRNLDKKFLLKGRFTNSNQNHLQPFPKPHPSSLVLRNAFYFSSKRLDTSTHFYRARLLHPQNTQNLPPKSDLKDSNLQSIFALPKIQMSIKSGFYYIKIAKSIQTYPTTFVSKQNGRQRRQKLNFFIEFSNFSQNF